MRTCPRCGNTQAPYDDDGDRFYYHPCPTCAEKKSLGDMLFGIGKSMVRKDELVQEFHSFINRPLKGRL